MIFNPDILHHVENYKDLYDWINIKFQKHSVESSSCNKSDHDLLITIVGGKYKGRMARVCKFTKCMVYVALVEENNRVVLLPMKSVFGSAKSDRNKEKKTTKKKSKLN